MLLTRTAGIVRPSDLQISVNLRAGLENEDTTEPPDDFHISVFFGGGNFGAAFFDVTTGIAYLVNDVVDQAPEFGRLRTVFGQVQPQHVICSNRQTDEFKSVLKELCGVKNDESSTVNENSEMSSNPPTGTSADTATPARGTPQAATSLVTPSPAKLTPNSTESGENKSQLHEVHPRAFGYSTCLRRIMNLRLPDEPLGISDEDHRVYLGGLINFKLEAAVRAFGALLKYIDECNFGANNLVMLLHIPMCANYTMSYASSVSQNQTY